MVSVGFERGQKCACCQQSPRGPGPPGDAVVGSRARWDCSRVLGPAVNLFYPQPEEPAVCAVDGTAGS